MTASKSTFIILLVFALALFATGANAQENISGLAGDGGLSARIIQLFLLVTVLSLAPGIAMMITCLPFMIIVFSILRQAIGLQQAPPNMLIMSLALFLTYFVMEPVFNDAWQSGVQPLLDGDITDSLAFERTLSPFRVFMEGRVSPVAIETLQSAIAKPSPEGEVSLSVLVPAFMLSEIQQALQIGFVIFLPFLIIDLVVASVLMAMGMMMVPPVIVSLPFKLAFFVLANGWVKIAGAVVQGYGV